MGISHSAGLKEREGLFNFTDFWKTCGGTERRGGGGPFIYPSTLAVGVFCWGLFSEGEGMVVTRVEADSSRDWCFHSVVQSDF